MNTKEKEAFEKLTERARITILDSWRQTHKNLAERLRNLELDIDFAMTLNKKR